VGERFAQYEHVKIAKKKGGKVFIAVSHDGAVEMFDGWLSQKEAKKLAKDAEREAGKGKPKQPSPSNGGAVTTQALQNYLDLHRHAAVRLALLAQPGVAFRLAVAHMAASSGNWNVRPDPQTTRTPAIRASIEHSAAQAAFADEERAVHALLGWQDEAKEPFIRHETCDVFAALLGLPDGEVLRIAAFFMARSLACGGDVVQDIGARLAVDVRGHWQADDTFFELVRDRGTVNALLAEVAGEGVAKANVAEKAKTQKQVIRDCLAGAHGRQKVDGWLPGWFAFPVRGVEAERLPDTPDSQPVPVAAE